jgi:hypothetical protein
MAQTGYTPISIYYSATSTNVPTAGNLVAGELAINTADGKLFYKDSSGVVQTLATKGGVGSSTTTQVLYNSSGSVVGSNNLVFTGTQLSVGTTSADTNTPLNVLSGTNGTGLSVAAAGGNNQNTAALKLYGSNGAFYSNRYVQIACYNGGGENVNSMTFTVGNGGTPTEAMRITSGGVVSIGNSTPAGWTSPFNALTMNTQGSLMATDGSMQMGNNIYYNGSYKFIGTGYANRYYQNGGDHTWTASSASGTAGGAVTENTVLTLNSSGCLILKGGTGTGAVGIAFPATQVASSDANTLDDYEEGTWTPTLYQGSTQITSATIAYGRYIKIGKVLWIGIYFYKASGAPSATGDWQIRNLPFSLAVFQSGVNAVSGGYTTVNGVGSTQAVRWQANASTTLDLYNQFSSTSWVTSYVEFSFSGCLETSS